MKIRRDPKLSRMSAYQRLAAKADRAGQRHTAARYRQIAERAYNEYLREKAARERGRRV